MADSKIVITAGLANNTVDTIRTELGEIAEKLNQEKAFKIQCHIDDSNTKVLQEELNGLAKKIKLNVNVTPQSVSKVQTDSSTTTTTVKVNSKDAESQIAELNKIIQNNLGTGTKNVLDKLVSDINQTLGQNSTIWTDWTKTTDGALQRFSVSVKNADGVVNKFNYTVDKTGKIQPLNIVGSDKGVLQNQKQLLSFIDEYTKKINALRSTNNANFTTEFKGQTVSFDSLLKDLEKLAKGEGSIEDVRAKFVALDGTIKSVITLLENSNRKSLNPVNNANISAKEFDNTLKKIGVDLNNLKGFKYTGNDDSIATVKELNSSYKDLKKSVKELNSVEEGNRGNEWYIKYAQVATQVRNLQNEIRLLNKLKKEDSSSGSQKQIEEINKIIGAYKKLIQIQKDKASSKTGDNERQWLISQEGGYRTLINSAIKRLEKEGLLTKEIKEQIKSEEKALSIIQNRIRVRQRDIEETKAQNEAAKASAQAQKEQERERSNIVTEIKNSYRELASLYAKKTSPTSGVDVQAEAARQEAALKLKIEELSTEEKLTEQDREQIRLAQEKYNNQIRLQDGANKNVIARQQEKQQTQEENQLLKQQIQERNKIVTEIENAYDRMIKLNEIMSSPKTKTNAYIEAETQFEIEQNIVREKERELQIYTQSLGYSNTLLEEDSKRLQLARDRYEAETSMQSARLKDADETKKQTEEYRKLVAEIKEYKTILSNFNNSNLMKQNKGNGDVSQQMKDNTELLGKLQQISAMLSSGKNTSLGVLTQARQQLNDLIKPLETATQRSEQLNNALTNQKINQQVSKNYNSLINQINTYARNNIKAIESTDKMNDGLTTYKDEWRAIQETANDASLKGNAAAITDLANRFSNFTGQARAAGLASTRFFVDMGSQLRMVLNRYISLYAVIGYIRKMVDNVKELDSAIINLRRVTDETNTGYVKFLEDANKQAKELKVTTSELVQQTYQWAKLGFDMNEALGLSKASTIFSKVADITEDQALKNLITTLKAYGIEAKNVMKIVDELDNLNNRYAVDAGGLGDGLERSASALAMTGNSLEQSLAMLTGAGEITQNLENTGNTLKIISLRLRNMKGALEELDEPVDDLMEVSKVQTQILNLTHNQVDIFDKKTQAFRSTYDIIKDVAEVWDSLNSTSQASLTEILFGKNRANIGLALIQAFQSGQVQKAYEDAVNSAGTATTEYEKMMTGIQAHINALKGAVEELSNTIAKSEGINFIIDRGKDIINIINAIVKVCGSLVIAIAPITGFITAKYKISFISMLKEIGASLRGLETNANGATRAMQALKSVGATLGSVIGGIAIGAAISGLAKLVDWLIVTSDELKEIRNEYHDALVDLKNEADELDESKEKLKSLAEEYSKISTTVADVSERKLQLAEIQNDLVTSYGEEADGIDLVNGKYSEQIKMIEELTKKQEEQFRIENAAEISKAQYLKNLRVSESDFTYSARLHGYVPQLKEDVLSYYSFSTPFTASTKDIEKVNEIVDRIDGIYNGAGGEFYLTGSLDEARDTLGKFLNEYRQIDGMNQKFLDNVNELYEVLNNSVQKINELEPYLSEPETTTPKINVGKSKVSGSTKASSQSDTQDIESESNAITSQTTAIKENITVRDILNATIEETKNSFEQLSTASEKANKDNQAFYDKLDEAQAKLLKMSSEDLSIDEYAALLIETSELEAELYKMSSFSSEASGYVTTLFEQFKKGTAESGDGLAEFVAKFENELEGAFKETAELVTGVQDAFEKMADGKGVDNAQAWKLLKADTEGYLQTIQLVNGEYVFAEEELLRFKDAKIKSSVEDIQASNAEAQVSLNNMKNKISSQYALLEAKRKELEINATLMSQQEAAKIFYEESSRIKIEISEMEQAALDWAKAIDRNNLLISELEQSYGRVGTMVADVPAYLSDTVSILEKEVSSIDKTIDSLNDRKDALEDEKSVLQDQLDILNEQKEAIEDTIKQYDSAASAISGYVKSQTKALQDQIDAMKETSEAIKKNYDDQIEELQKQNEERDDAIKKEKALADLQNAQNQKKRVYSSDRGWSYEASKADILEAQNALADIDNELKIKTLEKERDAQLEELDNRQKEYETQIKNFEDYAQKYADVADNIKQAESELVAEQILGSDWRVKIEQLDEELLTKYSNEYTQFNTQLNNLVNNEIKSLQDSIDAKDKEIKKIDDEIKAYEKYKSSVESNLKDAKSALEEYEKTMSDVSSSVIQSSSDMENAVWRYFSNIQQWITDTKNTFDEKGQGIADDCEGIIAATVRLRRELQESATGFGIINSAGDASILVGHYANGGVIDQTGLAMVHGSQTSSETAFSAKDSSKLYNFVHDTPNIMAAIIKQATRISNTMPTANAENTSNSISVTIGQVVANNPSELTQNLDKHLDSYFRRKLTQSYVQ